MGNIEPGSKAILWSETRQPVQTWTTQMKGLINSVTFPGMVLDVKGTETGLLRLINESLQVTKSTQINFLSFWLFRWQNIRQGPRGNNARERGEAEPTVGDRTAVKTSRSTWEIHWKPELPQLMT